MAETIVIIGNGISGITAARHIRKGSSDAKIIVISKETDYFFSRTALMYVYMGHMKFEHTQPYEPHFWKKNRIELLRDEVSKVDFNANTLHFSNNKSVKYDKLVLALGSKVNKFGWPGQDLKGVHGMFSYQDLDELTKNTDKIQEAVIVGGGLIGIELAEMLLSRGKKVTFLVRETSFWNNILPKEESELVTKHIQKHHLELQLEAELKEIVADEHGYAKAVITSKGETLLAQFVGLTAGVSPNIDFLKDSALECQRGIMINEYMETNIPNVYAIGDCAQHIAPLPDRRPVEQVWYTGRMMGETVSHTILGNKKAYNPGPWFNSAKFMDLEYQTYGMVYAKLQEGQEGFCWQHAKEEKLLKIVFEKKSGTFVGINNFGIRLRHEYFDALLRKKASVTEVLSGLKSANFDPEFFSVHETEIIEQFNKQYPQFAAKTVAV